MKICHTVLVLYHSYLNLMSRRFLCVLLYFEVSSLYFWHLMNDFKYVCNHIDKYLKLNVKM